jgi:GxxExxY protein
MWNQIPNLLASLNLLEIQTMNTTSLSPSAGLPESVRDPITHRFIGHAMKVHSLVGPGLDEEIYHQELVAALTAAGIPHLSKPRRDLVYRGIVADTFEPDFVIEDHFIPELKSLRGTFSAEHLVQVFCYCKFWRLRTSLLVDFGKQSLIWERLLYRSHSASLPENKPPEFVGNPALAASIIQAVGDCLNEIGLGYRQTTWKGLVSAAIQSAGHKVLSIQPPRCSVIRRRDGRYGHRRHLRRAGHSPQRRHQRHRPRHPANPPPLAQARLGHRLPFRQNHRRPLLRSPTTSCKHIFSSRFREANRLIQ